MKFGRLHREIGCVEGYLEANLELVLDTSDIQKKVVQGLILNIAFLYDCELKVQPRLRRTQAMSYLLSLTL